MPEQPDTRTPKDAPILAFDYGRRRIGVAVGVESAGNASPLATLNAGQTGPDWKTVEALVAEWRPALLLVGLPTHMDETETDMTNAARAFANELSGHTGVSVELIDERLSSFEAETRLKEMRRSGQRRRRLRKEHVDSMAAVVILETWLAQKH